jgi:branched-chain amino acid transport system permease protein
MSRIAPIGAPVVTLSCLVLVLVLSDFDLYNLTLVASLAIVVMGLNLLLGRLGAISAGHGALMGIGGYCTAILIAKTGLPYAIALIAATLVSALSGAVVGLPALRIRGLSLGLVTLGLAILLPELISHFASFTGGPNGFRWHQSLHPTDSA